MLDGVAVKAIVEVEFGYEPQAVGAADEGTEVRHVRVIHVAVECGRELAAAREQVEKTVEVLHIHIGEAFALALRVRQLFACDVTELGSVLIDL